MIRKEILENGQFGGNFPFEIDYVQLPQKFIEISEEQRDIIDSAPDKYAYDVSQPGIFDVPKGVVDISSSEEYISKIESKRRERKKLQIQNEINEIDKKRIRALAEPQLKDTQNGQTWLEYYTLQVQELRNQIASL